MSENQNTQSTSPQKMLVAMAGIGTICALLIVLTYEGTKPRVERLKAEALQNAIFNVLPGISSTQAFVLNADGKLEPTEDAKAYPLIFAGYDENENLKGFAIEATGQGYADFIKVLYGYDHLKHSTTGFYVLETKETPGLGDKIQKDEKFLANFNDLDLTLNADESALANDVVTVKNGEKSQKWEVDGITGATISSRAVGKIINESGQFWMPVLAKNINELVNGKTESIAPENTDTLQNDSTEKVLIGVDHN